MIVKPLIILTCFLITNQTVAKGLYRVSKKTCKEVEEKIKLTNDQLRAGYSVKRGERLKQELRELKDLKFSCKKHGYQQNIQSNKGSD